MRSVPRYLDQLLAQPFCIIPGEAYNRYRQKVAEEPEPPRLYYELPLSKERPWSYLRDTVYPSFVRYLKAKRLDPEYGEGVVVAVFRGSQCYLLEGETFLKVFKEIEGLDTEAFHFRIRQWLSA